MPEMAVISKLRFEVGGTILMIESDEDIEAQNECIQGVVFPTIGEKWLLKYLSGEQ